MSEYDELVKRLQGGVYGINRIPLCEEAAATIQALQARVKELEAQLKDACDQYGNPLDGSEFRNCSYPDCGCGEARLCPASSGANYASIALNRPRRKEP